MQKTYKVLSKYNPKFNEPLKAHTYFKIGGPADVFLTVYNSQDLTAVLQICIKNKLKYFILGSGSNILVSDKGFRGVVIKNKADKIKTTSFHGTIKDHKTKLTQALIEAESGAMLNKLSRFSIEEGLRGLEVFLSVPGTVGGAIYNNSHYRPEKDEFIGNHLHSAQLLTRQGKVKQVDQSYFKFKYDYSILHKTHETVIKASFLLSPADKNKLWQKATTLIKRRNKNQPIGIACSGCVFQNPTNSKLSAGALIDKAGLKGTKVGGAQVNLTHANFIENKDNATAQDVIKLIDKIKTTIKAKYNIELKPEIFLVGEFDE